MHGPEDGYDGKHLLDCAPGYDRGKSYASVSKAPCLLRLDLEIPPVGCFAEPW